MPRSVSAPVSEGKPSAAVVITEPSPVLVQKGSPAVRADRHDVAGRFWQNGVFAQPLQVRMDLIVVPVGQAPGVEPAPRMERRVAGRTHDEHILGNLFQDVLVGVVVSVKRIWLAARLATMPSPFERNLPDRGKVHRMAVGVVENVLLERGKWHTSLKYPTSVYQVKSFSGVFPQ